MAVGGRAAPDVARLAEGIILHLANFVTIGDATATAGVAAQREAGAASFATLRMIGDEVEQAVVGRSRIALDAHGHALRSGEVVGAPGLTCRRCAEGRRRQSAGRRGVCRDVAPIDLGARVDTMKAVSADARPACPRRPAPCKGVRVGQGVRHNETPDAQLRTERHPLIRCLRSTAQHVFVDTLPRPHT